jgi:hypothetical protein
MGTWGPWPTQNDSAMDFLDERSEEGPDLRAAKIQDVFSAVIQDPEVLGRSLVPEEVVAAAAVVASSLPSGSMLPWRAEEAIVSALISEESASAMTRDAVRAVGLATSYRGSWWHESWTNDDDRRAAESALDELRRVLLSRGS